MSGSSLQQDVSEVISLIKNTKSRGARYVIGIAGPPGSGKSTLAEAVVEKLNTGSQENSRAALLPMDGYHLDNFVLEQKGLMHRKGAIETFNSIDFCNAVKSLSCNRHDAFYPKFEREYDTAIANAIWIKSDAQVIVVEGNYLLMPQEPWSGLSEVFDASVFISTPVAILKDRLIQRWVDHGLDYKEALKRIEINDIPNASLILNNSQRADLTLKQNLAALTT